MQSVDDFIRPSNAVMAHDVDAQLGSFAAPTMIAVGAVPPDWIELAGRCRASFSGRTPEFSAKILRQRAALDSLHQVGDGVEMRLSQDSQVS